MIERQLSVVNKATSAAGADEWPPSPEAGIGRPAMPAKTVLLPAVAVVTFTLSLHGYL